MWSLSSYQWSTLATPPSARQLWHIAVGGRCKCQGPDNCGLLVGLISKIGRISSGSLPGFGLVDRGVGKRCTTLHVFLPSILVRVEYLFPSEFRYELMQQLSRTRKTEKYSENTLSIELCRFSRDLRLRPLPLFCRPCKISFITWTWPYVTC